MASAFLRRHRRRRQLRQQRQNTRAFRIEPLERRVVLTGFTAYNGIEASALTDPNTTFYGDLPGRDAAGPLRDVITGAETSALLTTSQTGVVFDTKGSNPPAGTDAYAIFDGFVDFAVGDQRSYEIEPGAAYQYTFENLDSGATYQFAGTVIRGNNAYTDRWTLVELEGADSFTAAHSSGTGVVTNGLQSNQVAIWAGDNSTQGYVAQWTDITPGDDGAFHVVSTQYRGTIPTSIDSGGVADASKSYAITGIRLIEDTPSGPPAVENSPAVNIFAFAAQVGGRIITTGGQVPNVQIFYGTTDGGTNAGVWDDVVDLGGHATSFETVIDGLSQDTQYYYRAFAENSLGSAWSPATSSFTTLTAAAPAIINQPATNVGAFSATLSGEVTDTGNDIPIVTVYYGDHDAGTNGAAWDRAIDIGVADGQIVWPITGLEPLTTYYFTTFAQNAIGNRWATPSLTFTTTDTPPVRITEFVADNTALTTRTRATSNDAFVGDQTTPDWLEVENPTAAGVDLGGLFLTDDLDLPKKWSIPPGTVIEPGGYLLFFASGKDITDPRLDEQGALHTNFQLDNAGGDDLALTDADGTVVFAFADIPVQSEDVSYGIDVVGDERFYPLPTPGENNANDTPRAPVFSQRSQTFSGSLTVALTSAFPTDTIRYTLNESVPTASSTLYTGPITLTTTTQIRAVAIGANGKLSTRTSQTYIALNSNLLDNTTNLPIVIVDTLGGSIGRSSFANAFFGVIEPPVEGRTRLTDEFTTETRGGIHIRGSSSAGFAKKQYRVEFWDESNEDRKLDLLGMPDEADWIFYGPSQYDRVLISNPLMFDLSNQIGSYAVRTQWVEMYLNSGGTVSESDYVGVYAIMEVIEQGDDRVDVEELTSGAGGQPVTGGFVWKNDRGSAYVDPDNPTSAQRSYIDGWINRLENAAAGPRPNGSFQGYEAYADVDSFIDHNILNLLAMNVDALRLSSFYSKSADGKLDAGPIWDFDRSLDSTDGRDNNPRSWYGTGDSTNFFNDSDRVMSWWPDMFDDPDFVQRYIDRWYELRQHELSNENLFDTIDKHAAEISEAAARDYSRWSGSRYGNFAGEISHLKTWLSSRVSWIDSQWLAPPTPSTTYPAVSAGTKVTLSTSLGQIYYTLDGSDPRGENGAIRPEAQLAPNSGIEIGDVTRITARVYRASHGSTSGGYAPTGDDWSPRFDQTYFTTAPASATSLAIVEINYHPHDPTAAEQAAGFSDSDDFEYIELMNFSDEPIALTGVQLVETVIDGQSEGIEFDFDDSQYSLLDPGQRILLVEDTDAFQFRYSAAAPVAGQWNGKLGNGGETLTVVGFDGSTIQQIAYSDNRGWPDRADGNGSSLEAIDPARDGNDPDNWQSSADYGGSPGAESRPRDTRVVINEILANSNPPLVDSIELANTTLTNVDLGGWFLSDSTSNYFKFELPAGTILPAGGYLVFDEQDFNASGGQAPDDFSLSSFGDDLTLLGQDAAGPYFVDRVDFGATLPNVPLGRLPDAVDGGGFVPLETSTLGSPNTQHRVGELIISEVHYNPDGADAGLEFIELYNQTAAPLDLSEWRINRAVDFSLPGVTLGAGKTVVAVSFDPTDVIAAATFRSTYGVGVNVTLLGPWQETDALDDGGERIDLERRNAEIEPGAEEAEYVLIDQVRYDDEDGWPVTSDGSGDSLQRTSASAFGNLAENWIAALPSPGSVNFAPIPSGDFDTDGDVDADDIDALFSAINSGLSADVYDLDDSGAVDFDDVTHLVEGIIGTSLGDANLDHRVDAADLNVVGIHWRDTETTWASGDFTGDGNTDATDLNVLALNWRTDVAGVAAPVARIPRAPLAAAAGQSVVEPVDEENGQTAGEAGATHHAAKATADQSTIDSTPLQQRNRIRRSQRMFSIQRHSIEHATNRHKRSQELVDIVFAQVSLVLRR